MELTLDDLDEVIQELEEEIETPNKPCRSLWCNVRRSWTRPKPERQMVVRFQKLAGIISDKTVAALILPNGQRVEFKSLPHWWDVVRYKLAGFIYETY